MMKKKQYPLDCKTTIEIFRWNICFNIHQPLIHIFLTDIDSQRVESTSLTSLQRRKLCENCGGVSPLHIATSEILDAPYLDIDLPEEENIRRTRSGTLTKRERKHSFEFYGFDGGGKVIERYAAGLLKIIIY